MSSKDWCLGERDGRWERLANSTLANSTLAPVLLPRGICALPHSPRRTLFARVLPPARKLLGGGHKSRVDGHTGSNAQSRGEANQGKMRTRQSWGLNVVRKLLGHVM